LLLAVFPLGWYFSYDLVSEHFYYAQLTIASMLSCALVLGSFRGTIKHKIHLLAIFLIFISAYYVKFYLLCYMKLHSGQYGEYLDAYYNLESQLFSNNILILNYYELITIVMATLSIIIILLIEYNYCGVRQSGIQDKLPLEISITPFFVKRLLLVTIFICIVLIYTQVQLGLGFVSGHERQMIKLPYHLAGIIMTFYNLMVPLLFLVIVWIADKIKNTRLSMTATGFYIIFGMVAGLLSTSKAWMLSTVISLLILWGITGTLSKKRFLLLASLIPFIMFFNTYLTVNRVLRGDLALVIHSAESIFEIMGIAYNEMFSPTTGVSFLDEPAAKTAQYLGLFMRVNGADSLLNIMNWNPLLSFERIWFLLFDSPDPVNIHYVLDVLGRPLEVGLAFSPSLLGYFMYLSGSAMFVSCGVIIYTVIWHIVFRSILNAQLLVEPIALALLLLSLAHYTSEGTLEAMPKSVAIIVIFIIIAECILRWLVRQRGMPLLSHPLLKRQP